jgi:hypothetical protein
MSGAGPSAITDPNGTRSMVTTREQAAPLSAQPCTSPVLFCAMPCGPSTNLAPNMSYIMVDPPHCCAHWCHAPTCTTMSPG